jgi:hypothetical protein
MHNTLKAAIAVAALTAIPLAADAGRLEGTGIGAGVGAIISGPVGAVVGGVVGYNVGGPNIVTRDRYRRCWHDDRGRRHCARR